MNKINLFLLLAAGLILSAILLTNCTAVSKDEPTGQNPDKVFELRTYTTHEGKLNALHQRFEDHTIAFFEKHGMTNIGYWIPDNPELKENTLIYLLSHESREAASKSWESFVADPEWQQVYEESRRDGAIVKGIESVYMESTPYSPMK